MPKAYFLYPIDIKFKMKAITRNKYGSAEVLEAKGSFFRPQETVKEVYCLSNRSLKKGNSVPSLIGHTQWKRSKKHMHMS